MAAATPTATTATWPTSTWSMGYGRLFCSFRSEVVSHRTAVAFAALVLAAAAASPQSLTGTVSGAVRDEQGAAVPDASVVVTGTTGSSSSLTDAGGGFRFAALAPGLYQLSIEKAGFTPRTFPELSLRIGAQLALGVVLKLAAREESVEVQESLPVVDVASAGTSNVLSSDLLFNLPIDRDDGLFNYAPGVTFYSAFGGGQGTTNALLLDGVDTREPQEGRGYIFINHNVVQEVEVQGIGAPAEYGGFTGAVVNTLTRSGGNRASGRFEARWSGEALASDNVSAEVATQNPALADPVVTRKLVDLTAQLSGPLVKDRLFYFANVQRYERVNDPAGQITRMRESDWRFNTKLT